MSKDIHESVAANLADYRLQSVRWSSSGDDLIIDVLPSSLSGPISICFTWATHVRLAMDFGEYSGIPLIFASKVTFDGVSNRCHVEIELGAAPEGSISLFCNDVLQQ